MKIAVFSDSHGDTDTMLAAVRSWPPDLILHLGDHARDAEELAAACSAPVRRVRGNCDMASAAPLSDMLCIDGKKIMMCHGHTHRVKLGLEPLLNAAHFSHADIVLFGHTHQAMCGDVSGMLVINPGSCGTGARRSWAKLTLEQGRAAAEIVFI